MPISATIQMWGRSCAIRIPRALARQVGLESGTRVTLTCARQGLLIHPVAPPKRKTHKLSTLLAQCRARSPHRDLIPHPSGREIF
jgi:antitoxin component of MazEF toxin-antitoxin module